MTVRQLHNGNRRTSAPYSVIAGLDPAIHEAVQHKKSLRKVSNRCIYVMDARVKPGHDG
jgi:hypothetical protein